MNGTGKIGILSIVPTPRSPPSWIKKKQKNNTENTTKTAKRVFAREEENLTPWRE